MVPFEQFTGLSLPGVFDTIFAKLDLASVMRFSTASLRCREIVLEYLTSKPELLERLKLIRQGHNLSISRLFKKRFSEVRREVLNEMLESCSLPKNNVLPMLLTLQNGAYQINFCIKGIISRL